MSGEDQSVSSRWQDFFRETAQPELQDLLDAYPNNRSFSVDIIDLHSHDSELAQQLLSSPESVLEAGEATLTAIHEDFEHVNIRLQNHPGLLGCHDVGAKHIREIVTIEGEITNIEPREVCVTTAVFECEDCSHRMTIHPIGLDLSEPTQCPSCNSTRQPVFLADSSVFLDIQRLTLTEQSTAGVEFTVVIDDDLVNTLSPNTNARITGIVRVDQQAQTNVFSLYLDAVGVQEEPASPHEEPKELQEVIQSRWEHMVQ